MSRRGHRRIVLALAVAVGGPIGCGRYGFESRASDGAIDDGTSTDGGSSIVATFGESSGAMFGGVTRDTFISAAGAGAGDASEEPLNFGRSTELRLDRDEPMHALVRFELTAIPPSAVVVSATLDVFVTQFGAAGVEVAVHPVLEPWEEGLENGGAGAANYTMRTASSAWSTAGAGTPGSAGPAIATFAGDVVGVQRIPIPVATAQAWVSEPATNFGIVMVSPSNNRIRIASSQGADAQRPMLTVTYVH